MKVGIIGAGTMGAGIAQAFAMTDGYEVCLCDIKQEFADGGKARIEKNINFLVECGHGKRAVRSGSHMLRDNDLEILILNLVRSESLFAIHGVLASEEFDLMLDKGNKIRVCLNLIQSEELSIAVTLSELLNSSRSRHSINSFLWR